MKNARSTIDKLFVRHQRESAESPPVTLDVTSSIEDKNLSELVTALNQAFKPVDIQFQVRNSGRTVPNSQ